VSAPYIDSSVGKTVDSADVGPLLYIASGHVHAARLCINSGGRYSELCISSSAGAPAAPGSPVAVYIAAAAPVALCIRGRQTQDGSLTSIPAPPHREAPGGANACSGGGGDRRHLCSGGSKCCFGGSVGRIQIQVALEDPPAGSKFKLRWRISRHDPNALYSGGSVLSPRGSVCKIQRVGLRFGTICKTNVR
jgi:hypothetical protein